jgi:predicted DNA-binding transcriptional regulator AlpA
MMSTTLAAEPVTVASMGRPLDVMGVAEISDESGVHRNTAWRWTTRPDFPEPAARLASGPIWHRREVERWVRKHRATRSS